MEEGDVRPCSDEEKKWAEALIKNNSKAKIKVIKKPVTKQTPEANDHVM